MENHLVHSPISPTADSIEEFPFVDKGKSSRNGEYKDLFMWTHLRGQQTLFLYGERCNGPP